MLTTLVIKHFTIVQHLELDFTKGMTAFTGETGAGKSIMIDALMLALGGRGDASVVRPGETYCDITASFIFDKESETALWLGAHDILSDEDELYLRRVIYAEGRSKSYINGQPFPLQKVKELSETLVHLHGQHQHQTLLQHQTHRQQLDEYAGHQELVDTVANQFKRYQQVKQKIEALNHQNQQQDKMQLLQFQLDELVSLDLQEGEIQKLHQEHQLLNHAKEYLLHSESIMNSLSSESSGDVCSQLNHILQEISKLPHHHVQIKTSLDLINSALIHCEEAMDEIAKFRDGVQLDPERLEAIDARMSAIHALARKNHIDSSQLSQFKNKLQTELENIRASEERLTALEMEQKKALADFQTAALKLRASRHQHAQKLEKDITAIIHQLGMPKGVVEIEISELDKIQSHGVDKVEYKVCTNPGMELDSLSKIASGGELSRIGLAIQMITAKRGATPTLIFDEVDVGIGGATAALVGSLLRQLGERLQIFCVTHQAQVASMAHNHYKVEKKSDSKQTSTTIIKLNETQKINEIARMLGGLTISEQTLSHARELLEEGSNL